jgi:hypothetical protein
MTFLVMGYSFWEENVGISLEIKRGTITIQASWSIIVWPINGLEERILPLENIFQIKDTSGLNWGHYTSIQISDLSNGTDNLAKENIFLNIDSITKLAGIENNELSIGTSIYQQRWLGNSIPSIYIQRSAGANYWYVGQYWSIGSMKINIPNSQAPGTYRWTMYYLLIDNN